MYGDDNTAIDNLRLNIDVIPNGLGSSYGRIEIKNDTVENSIVLDGLSGNIDIFGVVNNISDRRLKTNIRSQYNSLEKIKELRGVSFAWKDKNRSQNNIGFIAQEVEEVYPELVKTREDGYKGVDYASLVSALVEAIKELDQKVTNLEKENSELKAELAKSGSSEIDKLKDEIAEIKALISQSQTVGK